jgi:hypothetical protein
MSVNVILLNPGHDDVTVGVGTAKTVAGAGRATTATLQAVGTDAQALLVAGVTIIPAAADRNQLASAVADWAAEHDEPEPPPETAPPEDAADDDIAAPPTASAPE